MPRRRQVLVIPQGYDRKLEAKTVFVAWKNTREASRAVRDALPFMRLADSVIVGAVTSGNEASADPRLDDLVDYLSRHGIPVETQDVHANGDIGQAIIDAAGQSDADLVVAGGLRPFPPS